MAAPLTRNVAHCTGHDTPWETVRLRLGQMADGAAWLDGAAWSGSTVRPDGRYRRMIGVPARSPGGVRAPFGLPCGGEALGVGRAAPSTRRFAPPPARPRRRGAAGVRPCGPAGPSRLAGTLISRRYLRFWRTGGIGGGWDRGSAGCGPTWPTAPAPRCSFAATMPSPPA